jgi:hypothetical protein
MGSLEEKREIQKATSGWLPEKNKELAELSGGGSMTFDVDWATFAGDLQGLNWLEFNGAQQVVNAFRMVGADDLGKSALRDSVKKVVVKNVREPNQKSLGLDGGVLTLACAFAKSPGGRFSHDEIRDFLTSKL